MRIYSSEMIEAIRALNPIECVISENTRLIRRSGVQFVVRCLFHDDRTPSFYVHPRKGVFYCHGCNVKGDVFKFVQLLHNCSFRQSVAFLAARAGLQIEGFRPSPEWTAKVSSIQARREKELRFARFVRSEGQRSELQ